MREVPQDLKPLLFGRGPRWHATMAVVLMCLGIGCLVVGIVGDAINRVPGLEPTNWLVLSAVLWVSALSSWFTAYYAAKEG